jgi:hypothetical protein
MPRARFEPAIPMFKRSKTVRTLDHAVIGTNIITKHGDNYSFTLVRIYLKCLMLLHLNL